MSLSSRPFRTAWLITAFALATLGAPNRGAAQSSAQLDLFRPAPIDGDGLAVAHAGGQGHLRFGAQLALDYAHDPLVWESRSGARASESRHIVEHQLVAHTYGSLGLFDRLVVFVGLPVNLVQRGEATQDLPVAPADGAGVGNPLLGARVLLLPERSSGFGLALQAEVAFPLARAADASQAYTGDSGVTFFPQAIAHYQSGAFRIAANLGYRLRQDHTFAALDVGDELTFGLGARIRVASHSTLLAELHGSSTTSNVFGREETPIEALGGYEYRHESGVTLMAGAGAGTRGFGAPDARGVLAIRYTTPARARTEHDDEAEDDETPDDDSIDAVAESSPTDAAANDSTASSEQTSPHSSAASTDLDGNPSPVDESATADADVGASDAIADADGDGIADADDACPQLAGVAENHGCPAAPLREIDEVIYFGFDSARLDPESCAVLDDVARRLREHPEVRSVHVEGHTDSRGSHAYNEALSRRRAAAVLRYLVRRGVAPSRIDERGFGHTQHAVADAASEDDHARNRRVEFRIVGIE